MTIAIMDFVGDHDRKAAKQGMEWINDLDLMPQTPGIMRPLWKAEGRLGRFSRRL